MIYLTSTAQNCQGDQKPNKKSTKLSQLREAWGDVTTKCTMVS